MKCSSKLIVPLAASLLTISAPLTAWADRDPGWELGAEIIYQLEETIDFEGGSTVELEDDPSIALYFGYRINSRLEAHFAFDWSETDYDVTVRSNNPAVSVSGSGSIESFTPRFGLNFNILEGPFTPFVTGNVGWAFIDTNIPDSTAQNVCWWDPWYGYICGTYQSTRTADEFVYGVCAGIRWDVGNSLTLRFAYNVQWLDLSNTTSKPSTDQFRLGVVFRN